MRVDESFQPYTPSPEAFARLHRIVARLERGGAPETLVVGAGASGLAAVDLLRAKGVVPRIADDRPKEALPEAARASLEGLDLVPLSVSEVEKAELVVLSPGVPRSRDALAPARDDNRLVGEVELASWFLHLPLVGITGTNGKSTTTALVGHILKQAYGEDAVFVGGNFGEPLSRLALAPGGYRYGVVELSSYQLESIVDIQFRAAVWLNLTPDHTDRYPSMRHYAAAKRRILDRRSVHGTAILNAKDPWCAEAGLALGGSVRWFAATPTSDLADRMGTLLPEPTLALRAHRLDVERYRLDNPTLIGVHNKANALAAIECVRHLDVPVEVVQEGLSTFRGLPHRLERVGERAGVRYVNDSKATNVESALTALNALAGPLVLIAGGRDKGAPWAPLVEAAEGKVSRVLAIGEAQDIVHAAFTKLGIAVEKVGTLERAVERAREVARAGEEVLLSPACASFDQFDSYAARGERFRALVLSEGEP